MKPSSEHRHRRRVQDHRSGQTRDLRSHIDAEIIAQGQDRCSTSGSSRRCTSRWSRSAPASAATSRRPQGRSGDPPRASSTLPAQKVSVWRRPALTPSRDWRAQDIYPDDRYATIVEELKMVARVEPHLRPSRAHRRRGSARRAIHIMNAARYFLPHILALSTNSPFWRRHGNRPEVVPLQGVRQVSAHQHPGLLPELVASTRTLSTS